MANDVEQPIQPPENTEKLPYKGRKRGPKPFTATKRTVERLNWKRMQIVDALPGHNWSISKAAISCGYKRSYAEGNLLRECANDKRFCEAVEEKKKEVATLAPWNLEELQRQYRKLLDECNAVHDHTNAKGVLDSLTRIQGGFLDRQAIEDPAKARELEQKEEEEAKRIAQYLLDHPTIKLHEVG